MNGQEKSKVKGQKSKVYVGLSGGVDSSVSAALLKKGGYDVTGVFIKVWQPDWIEPALSSSNGCTWREDRLDAMRVAAKLGIPFVTLDLEKEYKKEVVDYMIREYKAGRTPNPDVMCNKHIKFGAFYDWARKKGADFVATGHYAQITKHGARSIKHKGGDSIQKDRMFQVPRYELRVAADTAKDQTYFLYNLTEDQLEHVLFPIGDMKKAEVRKLAHTFDLITADKKDSQGLCFIGKIDMREFLSHYIKEKSGDVLDTEGKKIGQHDGAFYFTIGQRHGFTITKKGTNDRPLYVVAKNVQDNTITVGAETGNKKGQPKRLKAQGANWLQLPEAGKLYEARIRYRQPLEKCTIKAIKNGQFDIEFNRPQRAITEGQSVVLYDGGVCIGGGIIV